MSPSLLPLPFILVLASLLSGPAAASTEPVGRWPLRPQPEVVRAFDPPEPAWTAGHRGVDLLGSIGQPVRAALGGDVTFTGTIAGTAVVVVDHGHVRTTYQPVQAAVSRGTAVAAGEVIGHLRWFGTHCLPAACLHWGLLEGERYLDPLTLVAGPRPIRLLPLRPVVPVQEVSLTAPAAVRVLTAPVPWW